jgi:diguanylate cyclase (GGDEF)-like protein
VVAFALVAAEPALPENVGLSTAHLFFATGFIAAWNGFRRFLGRQPLSPRALAGLGMVILLPLALIQIEGSLPFRTAVGSFLIVGISVAIARELLRDATTATNVVRSTGWLYVANAAVFALRFYAAVQQIDGFGRFASIQYGPFALLWWLCMTMGSTLCMVLMTGERLQADLNQQATRDPLTGALNRRAFTSLAEKEIARTRRNGGALSVLMMDLDHFKMTNDHLGHAGGDTMLCLFVDLAGRALRGEDALCRFGGEEFVAILPGSSAEQALAVAARLCASYAEGAEVATSRRHSPLPVALTVSIGVAELQPGEGLESIIGRADAALYRAKAGGRNRSELAEPLSLSAAQPVSA